MAAACGRCAALRGPGRCARSGRALVAMAGPGRRRTGTDHARARLAVQRDLFLGHHGRAQGHRAVLGHALGACAARSHQRLRARCRLAMRHAAVFQHHAGGGAAHAGAGRHAGADAQVRCHALSGAGPAARRHPHHAGARAVPAPDGLPGFRPHGLEPAATQVLHQRALQCRAQGRGAAALAGPAHRVLRHDRRRRALRTALP